MKPTLQCQKLPQPRQFRYLLDLNGLMMEVDEQTAFNLIDSGEAVWGTRDGQS